MKQLHKPNLWSFSLFNAERNLDFHSVFWSRPAGNVLIDPLPLSEHDAAHLERLGGVRDIILTNSDHARAAAELRERTSARLWGPRLEPAFLESIGARALAAEHSLGADLEVLELQGSKTPGELCLLLEGDTLVVGDLIRGHRAGRLNLLPDAKLGDKALALQSLEALTRRGGIEAVLVGDGWPVFRGGSAALLELLLDLRAARPS
jgi:glyoxylase-like metal-dependent hydrolase (beta-lactamase superfamily II)